MLVTWMFRATDLVSKKRGMLSVCKIFDRGMWIRFVADGDMAIESVVPESGFVFAGSDEADESLPSPDDELCRDLGKVTMLMISYHPGSTSPVPSYELRGRLPVTGERQSTAVVAVEHPMRARGAGRG